MREMAEGKPVQIGQLQRYATDVAMEADAAALRPRRADRQARRRGRRRSGRPLLRPPARHARPRRRHLRRASRRSVASTNTASPPTSRVDDFAGPRSSSSSRSAASRSRPARCSAATSRSPSCRKISMRSSSASGLAASMRWHLPHEPLDGVADAVALHRRAPPGERPRHAAGRPPGGGDRRRHDGDRHRERSRSASAPRT